MDDAQALDAAVRAARAGGEVARAMAGVPEYIRWKGQRDIVSGASLAVQEAILRSLRSDFPDHGILAEEGPDDEAVPLDAEHLWIVDPVCGSLNFVQGIPYYAVSIALRSQGEIRVGVVYDPSRDEMFEATVGTSATLNGQLIYVQQISEGYDAFEKAWIGTDLPYSGARREDAQQAIDLMSRQVISITTMGSPALGICNVAAGRLHAYWNLDLKIWDFAAASIILKRAGGTLTDGYGDSWLHSDGGYIASNSIIHGWTLRSLQQVYEMRKMEPFGVIPSTVK